MEQISANPGKIKGWGIDADPENRPAFPMRDEVEDDKAGMTWQRPVQQEETIEILRSNERPNMSAVFGTSIPPQGISGFIRRRAFKYTESNWAHWLLLMLADRINMIEGIVQDLGQGRIPNIPAEMGIWSEIKYNFRNFMLKAIAAVFILCAIIAWII